MKKIQPTARRHRGENKPTPQVGDCVMHCGHIDAPAMHWWKLTGVLRFRRPDGSAGEADWLAACDPCFQLAGGDDSKIGYCGDFIWTGGDLVYKPDLEA